MKNSFENPHYPGSHTGNRHEQHQHPIRQKDRERQETQEKHQMKRETEDILTQLEKEIDEDASNIGLVVACLFKTLTMAHSALPCMDLETDLFHIVVDEASISVIVFDPECVKRHGFPECGREGGNDFDEDFDDFDDEEDGYEFED